MRKTYDAAFKANLNERSVWKKDKLYTIETDEQAYPLVTRYQKNFSRIVRDSVQKN